MSMSPSPPPTPSTPGATTSANGGGNLRRGQPYPQEKPEKKSKKKKGEEPKEPKNRSPPKNVSVDCAGMLRRVPWGRRWFVEGFVPCPNDEDSIYVSIIDLEGHSHVLSLEHAMSARPITPEDLPATPRHVSAPPISKQIWPGAAQCDGASFVPRAGLPLNLDYPYVFNDLGFFAEGPSPSPQPSEDASSVSSAESSYPAYDANAAFFGISDYLTAPTEGGAAVTFSSAVDASVFPRFSANHAPTPSTSTVTMFHDPQIYQTASMPYTQGQWGQGTVVFGGQMFTQLDVQATSIPNLYGQGLEYYTNDAAPFSRGWFSD